MFVLVNSNQDGNAKMHRSRGYYLIKSIIWNWNIIINGKNVYDQPIDSHIKSHEEIRNLAFGQGEDYTTGCLLDMITSKIITT